MTLKRFFIETFQHFSFHVSHFFYFLNQFFTHPLFYMALGLGLTSFFLFIYHDLFENRTFLESQFIFLFAAAMWLSFLFLIELFCFILTFLIARKFPPLTPIYLSQPRANESFAMNVDFSSLSFSFFTQIQWVRPFLFSNDSRFSSVFTIFTFQEKIYSLSSNLPRGVFYPTFRFLFFFFPYRLFKLFSSPFVISKPVHVHPQVILPSFSMESFFLNPNASNHFHDLDFQTYRPYSFHDDARRIDWRVSSRLDPRHQQLYVRQYEPSEQQKPPRFILILDTSLKDHSLYESCISSMAGAFSYLLSKERFTSLNIITSNGLISFNPQTLSEGLDFLSLAPSTPAPSSFFIDLNHFSTQKLPSCDEFPFMMMESSLETPSFDGISEGIPCFFTPHLKADQWNRLPSHFIVFTYHSEITSSRIFKLETSLLMPLDQEALDVL